MEVLVIGEGGRCLVRDAPDDAPTHLPSHSLSRRGRENRAFPPGRLAVADCELRAALENGLNELRDVAAVVLVVPVGVNGDVGTVLEAIVDAGREDVPESAVSRESQDVVQRLAAEPPRRLRPSFRRRR